MSGQFHEERASGLAHGVHQRIERYGVGVLSVERVANAEPDVEVREQMLGGNCKIS